jgi:phosphoribosylformylglycinamidine cyclo-ligase
MNFMYDTTKPYTKKLLEIRKSTWETPYIYVSDEWEGLTLSKRKKPYDSYFEADETDGIGTKGYYHRKYGTLKNAVLDSIAMNLNDMLLSRATPYRLIDHIMSPEEDSLLKIFEELASECRKRKIAITAGESAVINTLDGIEMGIFLTGFVETPVPNRFMSGDCLVGFHSNGLHSNGFTKVRELFGDEFRQEFVEPTRLYYDELHEVVKNTEVHGMAHITGGAFTKLRGRLNNLDAVIEDNGLIPHKIFYEIYDKGLSDRDMYEKFNCGTGFIISTSPSWAEKMVVECERAEIIGKVVPGKGKVKINSAFSDSVINL